MQFDPHDTDITGQIIAQGGANTAKFILAGKEAIAAGITKGGEAAEGAIKQWKLNKQELDLMSGDVAYAANKGLISPDDATKFQEGSMSTKRAIGNQARVAIAQNPVQANLNNEAAKTGIDAYNANTRRLEANPLTLTPEEQKAYYDQGYVPVRVGTHGFNAIPGADKPTPPLDPATLPRVNVNGRDVVLIPKGYSGITGNPTSGASKPLGLPEIDELTDAQANFTKTQQQIKDDQNLIKSGKTTTGILGFGTDLNQRVKDNRLKLPGLQTTIDALQARMPATPQAAPLPRPAPPAAPAIDPTQVMPPPLSPGAKASAAPSAPGNNIPGITMGPDGIPIVSDPAAVAQLPSGTQFRTPTGALKLKP